MDDGQVYSEVRFGEINRDDIDLGTRLTNRKGTSSYRNGAVNSSGSRMLDSIGAIRSGAHRHPQHRAAARRSGERDLQEQS